MVSIVYELGAVVVGLVAFWFAGLEIRDAYRSRKRKQLLKGTTPVEPGAATDGEATVVGTVVAEETLSVPVGDGDCVAYYADVFNAGDTPYEKETEAVPFWIEGDDGAIAVDPEDLTVETTSTREDRLVASVFATYPDDYPEEIVEFVDELDDSDPSGRHKITYHQQYIAPGDTATVHGTVEERDGQSVLTGGDGEFFVTDEPPTAFLDDRPPVLKRTVKNVAISLGFGIVLTPVGLVMLLV